MNKKQITAIEKAADEYRKSLKIQADAQTKSFEADENLKISNREAQKAENDWRFACDSIVAYPDGEPEDS